MNSSEFDVYKRRYRGAIKRVLRDTEVGRLDENGFPAYAHLNPLINWLFWRRIHMVMNYLEKDAPFGLALDFGCGSGVMLPFLSAISRQVVASDIDLVPLESVRKHIPLAPNVRVHDAAVNSLSDLPANSVDVILALDVLEHVTDLQGTLTALLRLLKPCGQLIVSGPTENALYRLGRRLAGSEFSGDYHQRGVAEIRQALGRLARIQHIATLYWPVPLFELFAAIA